MPNFFGKGLRRLARITGATYLPPFITACTLHPLLRSDYNALRSLGSCARKGLQGADSFFVIAGCTWYLNLERTTNQILY